MLLLAPSELGQNGEDTKHEAQRDIGHGDNGHGFILSLCLPTAVGPLLFLVEGQLLPLLRVPCMWHTRFLLLPSSFQYVSCVMHLHVHILALMCIGAHVGSCAKCVVCMYMSSYVNMHISSCVCTCVKDRDWHWCLFQTLSILCRKQALMWMQSFLNSADLASQLALRILHAGLQWSTLPAPLFCAFLTPVLRVRRKWLTCWAIPSPCQLLSVFPFPFGF